MSGVRSGLVLVRTHEAPNRDLERQHRGGTHQPPIHEGSHGMEVLVLPSTLGPRLHLLSRSWRSRLRPRFATTVPRRGGSLPTGETIPTGQGLVVVGHLGTGRWANFDWHADSQPESRSTDSLPTDIPLSRASSEEYR